MAVGWVVIHKLQNLLDCPCNVCTTGGAAHNGCVYREIVRLRNNYKLFDRRNLCICSVCVPFKYRTMCLRQELRILRQEGKDEYFRSVSVFMLIKDSNHYKHPHTLHTHTNTHTYSHFQKNVFAWINSLVNVTNSRVIYPHAHIC